MGEKRKGGRRKEKRRGEGGEEEEEKGSTITGRDKEDTENRNRTGKILEEGNGEGRDMRKR